MLTSTDEASGFGMALYAVGDVQGHYDELRDLLEQVHFDARFDQLWFVGDLVNRGPRSLDVLRFVKSLGSSARVVLGNHDIHLLAVAAGVRRLRSKDTLQPVLDAPDASELLSWLERQPLAYADAEAGYAMVHAGIPPGWDLSHALELAREAERWLRTFGYADVAAPTSEEPLALDANLSAAQRARVIVNYFTRMRVCTLDGHLDLEFKGPAEEAPEGYLPWFAHPERKTRGVRLIFGHWAALQGRVRAENVYALDTGCSWGRELTLMRLGDDRRFGCECVNQRRANESE